MRRKTLRNAHRKPRFESLESREMLAADLGFAGAFSLLGPATHVSSINAPFQSIDGGLVTDSAGNRYVTINNTFAGSPATPQTVDLDPGPGVLSTTMESAVVKLDPQGNVLWTAPFSAADSVWGAVVRMAVAVDANQNVYLSGDFRGTFDADPGPGVVNVTSTAGGDDYAMYMAKLNSAGQLQWVRTLAANELTPFQVDVDAAGNLIVASNFTAVPTDPPMDVDAGPGQVLVQEKGNTDLVLLKYDTNGNFVWVRQFGDATATMFGDTPALSVSDQGDVFVSGRFQGSLDLDPGAGAVSASGNAGENRRFLDRLDSAGNYVWSYLAEGTGATSIHDIDFTSDGSLIISGSFEGAVDFQAGSGSLVMTSTGTTTNGYVLKMNSDSSVAWARQFGGLGTNALTADLDQAGNIYLGGSFGYEQRSGENADFDPGPGVYNLFPPSTYETAFVLSLTNTGDFRWAVPLGGNTGLAFVQGLGTTPDGNVHISGPFRGTGDFDPDPGVESWLGSGENQTVFTATLKQTSSDTGAPIVDAGADQTISVTGAAQLAGSVTDDGLPNPVTFGWSAVSGPGSVSFANPSSLQTSATFSTSGTYLLALTANDGQFTSVDYVHITVNPLAVSLSAGADTYIDGGDKTTNFGSAATLSVNGKPDDAALIKWDLSSIPAGSTLQSVTLSLNVTGASTNRYEIYDLKRDWSESQATWKLAAKKNNWQIAGADGALDRGTNVLGSVIANGVTGKIEYSLNAAGVTVVQGWINNPSTNFGFVIQDYANANKDDFVFSSRESTVAANRPQLQLVYNPPAAAAQSLAFNARLIAQGAPATGSSMPAPAHATTSAAPSQIPVVSSNANLLDLILAKSSGDSGAKQLASTDVTDKNDSHVDVRDGSAMDLAFAALGGQLDWHSIF